MPTGTKGERWRIGVLAERVGVNETLLRAWELRYGLLMPARTAKGYRLYGPEDERRARAMVEAREAGVPAAQAAAQILEAERVAGGPREAAGAGSAPARAHASTDDAPQVVHRPGLDVTEAIAELRAAMVAYDVASMHHTIDRVLATVSVESAISQVLLPFMCHVGDSWASGDIDVADEHFASDLVRARLAALSLGATPRTGPLVLMACPPGESHDIALKAFEVVLQRGGWRTRFLGPDLPLGSLEVAARIIEPDLVVLAATRPEVFADLDADRMRRLSARHHVLLAGEGSDAGTAQGWGAHHLAGDPVEAARSVVRRRTSVRERSGPGGSDRAESPE